MDIVNVLSYTELGIGAAITFALYLSGYILCTLLNNIAVFHVADRLYPCLREQDAQLLHGWSRWCSAGRD